MRRLENEDEDKFWEAWVKDAIFYYRFGKIGSPGQTKLKRFTTDADAEVELEEKLQEKLKQGFAEPGEKEAEESESDDEESDDEESDDEEESDESDDDEESDDAKPAKKTARKKTAAVAVVAVQPAGPTLPVRFQRHTPKPEQISAAKAAVLALHEGLGGRSWKVARLARKARQALERVGGIDPHDHGALGESFDALMADVLAAEKKLPLEVAMQLLFELDPKVFVRTVKRWKPQDASPLRAAIDVLHASVEVGDAELALHTAAALADRTLDARAWKKRFAKVKPLLEEALTKRGSSVGKFCKALHAGEDKSLHAHIEEMAR
jgi:predicted DNA-binding WGR domain protein